TNVRVTGTTHQYEDVFNYELALGRFFLHEEDLAKQRVVVLGADVPNDLEVSPADLLGETIALNSLPFTVIGIFASAGGAGGDRGPDSSAFVPIRTAEQRIFG